MFVHPEAATTDSAETLAANPLQSALADLVRLQRGIRQRLGLPELPPVIFRRRVYRPDPYSLPDPHPQTTREAEGGEARPDPPGDRPDQGTPAP